MDKLYLAGQNLGRVYKLRSGCVYVIYSCFCEAKQLSLKLKTRPKQLLGSHPLDITLPVPTIAIFPHQVSYPVLAGTYACTYGEKAYGTGLGLFYSCTDIPIYPSRPTCLHQLPQPMCWL
jgi:hypothetical protein